MLNNTEQNISIPNHSEIDKLQNKGINKKFLRITDNINRYIFILDNMSQEQKRNYIISIVAIALVAGGIFYYQKKNQNSAVPEKQDTAGGKPEQ